MTRLAPALYRLPRAPPPGQLHLYSWNNYIAPDTVKRFEESCKCAVVQTYYSDNEELLAKLAAGAKGYDVYVPTSNAVQALIKGGRLKPVDKAQLPNLKNVDPAYLNTPFDPDNKYSVPYAMSTTILGYNDEKMKELGLPTDTWAVIFDPKHLAKIKGRVTVLDSANELFAAALKYLGYSANDVDPKHWDEAVALIKKAKPYCHFTIVLHQELTVEHLAGRLLERHLPGELDAQAAGIQVSGSAEGRRRARAGQHGDPQERTAARSRTQVHDLHARRQELGRAHQPHRLGQSEHGRREVHQARIAEEPGDLPRQGGSGEARAAPGSDRCAAAAAQQAVDGDQSGALRRPVVPRRTPAPRGRSAVGGATSAASAGHA
jgi:hypothetical protein